MYGADYITYISWLMPCFIKDIMQFYMLYSKYSGNIGSEKKKTSGLMLNPEVSIKNTTKTNKSK